MPTPPKPPEQRRRRNTAAKEQPKRASSTSLPATNRRKAPPPPAWLEKRLHTRYRDVWRSSVASLWPPDAGAIVARLVQLRDRVERLGDEVKPATLSALLQLERELLLTPKSARASGVTVRDETAPVDVDVDDEQPTKRRRRSTVTADRRDRVLRAVS